MALLSTGMKEVMQQKEIAVISKDMVMYLLRLDVLRIVNYEPKQ